MPKTKKVRSSEKETNVSAHVGMSCGCCHHTSVGQCWMCWLFKSLIALFCAFLLIWVGFCLGIMHHSSSYSYSNDGTMMKMGNVCSKGSMSQHMSSKSIGMMDGGLEALRGLIETDFDKEFLIQMILHHEQSLEMAQMALKKSDDPEILKLAQTIIDEQTDELKEMKEWGSE